MLPSSATQFHPSGSATGNASPLLLMSRRVRAEKNGEPDRPALTSSRATSGGKEAVPNAAREIATMTVPLHARAMLSARLREADASLAQPAATPVGYVSATCEPFCSPAPRPVYDTPP